MEDKTQLCPSRQCSPDHWNQVRTLPGKTTSSGTSVPKPLSSPMALSHNICPSASVPFLTCRPGAPAPKDALPPSTFFPLANLTFLQSRPSLSGGGGWVSDCFLITKWRGINNTMQKLKKKNKGRGWGVGGEKKRQPPALFFLVLLFVTKPSVHFSS